MIANNKLDEQLDLALDAHPAVNWVCRKCGKGFEPEGGKRSLCNTCSLKAWGLDRAEEYRELVIRLWREDPSDLVNS